MKITQTHIFITKFWSGLSLIIFQLTLYPYVERTFGPISIARITGVSFYPIVEIIAFQHIIVCYLKYVLLLWFHMQMLSVPLLQSYPFIAMLSGVTLYIVISAASILKNILAVSAPLCQ